LREQLALAVLDRQEQTLIAHDGLDDGANYGSANRRMILPHGYTQRTGIRREFFLIFS